MVNRNIKFTYRDYMATPDDKRYEILDGDMVVVPSPSVEHQRILGRLFSLLNDFVRARQLGEVLMAPCDVVLSDYDVLQPDLLFISKERAYIVAPGSIRGAPDLVVEILSPSTEERDRTVKGRIYARYGVREYWLVSPEERSVEVLVLSDEGYRMSGVHRAEDLVTSPLLEGLALPVKGLFTP